MATPDDRQLFLSGKFGCDALPFRGLWVASDHLGSLGSPHGTLGSQLKLCLLPVIDKDALLVAARSHHSRSSTQLLLIE